jgi:hypothetical protein
MRRLAIFFKLKGQELKELIPQALKGLGILIGMLGGTLLALWGIMSGVGCLHYLISPSTFKELVKQDGKTIADVTFNAHTVFMAGMFDIMVLIFGLMVLVVIGGLGYNLFVWIRSNWREAGRLATLEKNKR